MKQRFSKRTRLVSALLTLAMVFTFLPFSAFAATDSYGPVYITDANVPDKTFREYLLKRFDKDGNGVLTPAERYAATEIDVENKYISNLSGIQFFPNLKVLNCGHNRLTKLDVSENTVLQELVCWENQLTSLDVSQNTALQELACFENQLTSLDVSQNPALQKLSCWDNRLTSLDVSKNTELTYLKCSYNRLTELDVSKNTELTYLDCGYNRLTELDVSQNTKLTELYFVSNKITSLQADNCTNLTVIFTGSNKYKVEVYKKTRILDPSILPGNFDISRVRNLKGATQNADGTLTVQEGGGKVTYEYRCVGEIYKPFTLNVTETDDPNAGIVPPVTPPSGGGDSIAINASNFPDPDFRTYVKAEFDKDNNNSLSESERKTVTVINVKDKLIETLEGIEFFPNLKELDCSINQLSRLDVSQNTALEKLDCSTNQLASLNLSKNAKLKYLYCSQNELTSLDVSQTAVTTLNASDNKIDIDVEETPRTFDLSTLPGKFDVTKATNWSGGTVSGKTLKVNEGTNQVTYTYACGKGRSETFTLNVKVVPDGTVTPPSGGDTPGGTTPGGSTGGGDGGAGIAVLAIGGVAVAGLVGYGVYSYVSEQQLKALLPEGVAVPENRAQTALLLWNTAGRPEPAAQPAFPDVADPDTAKAAQWCVEQGLMNLKFRGPMAPPPPIRPSMPIGSWWDKTSQSRFARQLLYKGEPGTQACSEK